jgi:hypothetical protein
LHEQAAAILREAGDRRGAFEAYFLAAEALSEVVIDERMVALAEALDALADDDGQRAMAAVLCAALADVRADLMQVIALRASAWMQLAASTLPPGWRENYLTRAPILQVLPPGARGLLLARGR